LSYLTIFSCALLISATSGISIANSEVSLSQHGPYLGQEPAGDTAELFAPWLFTPKNEPHDTPRFSVDLRMVHWATMVSGCRFMQMSEDGSWSEIKQAEPWDCATISPDGNRKYRLTYDRPPQMSFPDKQGQWDEYFWWIERDSNGWSEPELVDSAVNKFKYHWQFCVAADYSLYFGLKGDLHRAEYIDGHYLELAPVPGDLNSKQYEEGLPCLAPDESYVVFARVHQMMGDLWVSFKRSDGTWSPALSLGDAVNTKASELCPQITPDGQFLMFMREDQGYFRVFWVSTNLIDSLHQSILNHPE
jgi:hypothetical protein